MKRAGKCDAYNCDVANYGLMFMDARDGGFSVGEASNKRRQTQRTRKIIIGITKKSKGFVQHLFGIFAFGFSAELHKVCRTLVEVSENG